MKQLVTILACLFIGFLVGSIIEYSRTHDIRLENNQCKIITQKINSIETKLAYLPVKAMRVKK